MKVGCFALVDPFSTLDHQIERIAGLGFKYADVTDNHPGGLLGREFGFSATASLDDNPADLKAMFDAHGLTITSVCAHANLLDASSPARYATNELMKAVRLAAVEKDLNWAADAQVLVDIVRQTINACENP